MLQDVEAIRDSGYPQPVNKIIHFDSSELAGEKGGLAEEDQMQVAAQFADAGQSQDIASAMDGAPCNVEIEQALLGAILINNDVHARVESIVDPTHFYDPVHRDIYTLAADRIRKHVLASPPTLAPYLKDHVGLAELGGTRYLKRLAESALSVHACRDYAEQIRDLALRRSLIEIGGDLANRAKSVDADASATDLIHDSEQMLYSLAEKGRLETGYQTFTSALAGALKEAKLATKRKSGLSGLATGLVDLDYKLGGLQRSDLIVIAGRPSMGKTALATNIAFNVANSYERLSAEPGADSPHSGGIVGFFSLEMSTTQLATRILGERARVSTSRIRRSELDNADFQKISEASRELEQCPLLIDDTPALSIAQVSVRARRIKRTYGLDLLVVDYLQLLQAAKSSDSRVAEVSEITKGLKAIAKDLDIPVIAISQLSRQVENREDKRPQLSDLRESGTIEQDADVVMFVYRKEYYLARTKPEEEDGLAMDKWKERMEGVHGTAELIIGKQRHGPIGTIHLSFDNEFTKFGNLATEELQKRHGVTEEYG